MMFNSWVRQNLVEQNRACLITGGSSGIGWEYARRFAGAGCELLLTSENEDELILAKQKLEAEFGIRVTCIRADFRSPENLQAFIREVARFEIGALVNNAGFGLKGAFEAFGEQAYADIISCHITYPTGLLKHVLSSRDETAPLLVINVVTINVICPTPKTAVYTATKSYCLSLFLSVEAENLGSNIIWHNCLPGTTDTPFHDKQGVTPRSMVMTPDKVVDRSLGNLGKRVFIPNYLDRGGTLVFRLLPLGLVMKISTYFMRKRLGVSRTNCTDL